MAKPTNRYETDTKPSADGFKLGDVVTVIPMPPPRYHVVRTPYVRWDLLRLADKKLVVYKIIDIAGRDGKAMIHVRTLDRKQIFTGTLNRGLEQSLFKLDAFLTSMTK